jgi:ubiquinone/menaquinone biosynthesis C-methylase UbiE
MGARERSQVTSSNYEWAAQQVAERYPTWVGIDQVFESALEQYLPVGGAALDVGCGRNSPLRGRRDRLRLMVGSDLDVDELRQTGDFAARVGCDGARLPFTPNTFDLVLSKTAIEHMADPQAFFAGVHRVLKPGGVFIWATSNLRSLPIQASRLTPVGVHQWVYRHIFGQALAIEQFPVYYRANTEATLDRQLNAAGFERLALHKTSWPCYFAFNRPLFSLMLPVHRWIDDAGLELLRVHLVGVSRKR